MNPNNIKDSHMNKKKEKKTKKIISISNDSKPLSSGSGHGIFGGNKLQISEDDASSHLVGSIIEKGISENSQNKPFFPTQPPKVSVLPFPVARHRAHGPHWGPVGSKLDGNNGVEDYEDDDEDNEFASFVPLSAFANPVQRKQKKGLDLSCWRELTPSDSSLETDTIEEDRLQLKKDGKLVKDGVNNSEKNIMLRDPSLVSDAPMEVEGNLDLSSGMPPTKIGEFMSRNMDVGVLTSASDMEIGNLHCLQCQENVRDDIHGHFNVEKGSTGNMSSGAGAEEQLEKMEKINPVEMLQNQEPKASTMVSRLSLNSFGSKQQPMSLESEIDAENRARIQSMSPEEIVQAQAEIMEKMDPALLNLLKKRGHEKLKKQKGTNDQLASSLQENPSPTDSNVPLHAETDSSKSSGMLMAGTPEDIKTGPNSSMQNLQLGNGSLWSTWSERVEAVRGLRFSLEGTLIADEPENGNRPINDRNSVAERDFLRTEGDPAAEGYTIKEAVQLTRSVIPGQRALALHLLASVLDKAIHNIQQNEVGCTMRNNKQVDNSIDWEAIWTYALGPEPELVLSLRMCLDDNHSSVVSACAKVIQCVLTCDRNENFFDISEKIPTYEGDIFTAPVFRSKPEVDVGFLRGGFWKYNTKPSNILALAEDVIDDEIEGQHTIQDDIVVAGQDFAAGLVRMGILPRMRYLLETDPTMALEESIISILIAIARHSPTCANVIMKCQRLIHIIVHRFTKVDNFEIHPSKIKSVILMKILAQSDKKHCIELIKNGYFETMTWHLYRYTSSIDQWILSGRENCKLSSAMMVEQLRFWKVCIHYGSCISYYSDIFPALCLWLNPPTFKKLQETNVLSEFTSISSEVYLVLEALGRKLPNFYSQKNMRDQNSDSASDQPESWSWRYITPIVDSALKWISLKGDPYISKLFRLQNGSRGDLVFQDLSVRSLLWVYSAIMHMLSTFLERVSREDDMRFEGSGSNFPWLPEFVPKIGLQIIKSGVLSFLSAKSTENQQDFADDGSFVEQLCHLRQQNKYETSLSSASCLGGLLRVITYVDNLIQLSKSGIRSPPSRGHSFSADEKILEDGILRRSISELRYVLDVFMKLIESEWHLVQSIEIFGRGGPAPGLGLGWGASGGGFWSEAILLSQIDAGLLIYLLEVFQKVSSTELPTEKDMSLDMHRINSILGLCLTIGPRDKIIMEKAINNLLQVPVFRYLNDCIQRFLQLHKRQKLLGWEYDEEDYMIFGKILASHFRNRWLSGKRKLKGMEDNNSSGNKTSRKARFSLDTVHEELDTSNMTSQDHHSNSLAAEWARQRLPLPMHWILSPISTISDNKHAGFQSSANVPNVVQDPIEVFAVARAGFFFLLGVEAMSTFLSTDVPSPVQSVPLVWKLHCLSVTLLVGMDVLEDDRSRDVYEALQDLYGQLLDETRSLTNAQHMLDDNVNLLPEKEKKPDVEFLNFQSEIHESYSTFLETLVEQFAAISYGDVIFGRQVAVYLHRCTEAPVRLAAWNLLANALVLEILPPLEKCFAEAEGYLEPIEENESMLEAYAKSLVSGALDRAASRGSMAYTLVLHHLSSFIFLICADQKIPLRNKLVKTLLRDYSQNKKREAMMLDLVRYHKSSTCYLHEKEDVSVQNRSLEKRFELLAEACDKNSSLLTEVQKLMSACK